MKRRNFLAYTTAGIGGLVYHTLPAWAHEAQWMSYGRQPDYILQNGLIYDGTGAAPVRADVAVEGDRILAVGPQIPSAGATLIDLNRLAVAPGFIDIHSHTDISLLVNPNAESKVRQGVTTEVVGQDGSSVGPWTEAAFEANRDRYKRQYDIDIDFRDPVGFFDRLTRTPACVNLASMIGAGTVRGFVIGQEDRPATDAEVAQMVSLVESALAAGVCGLSSGLEYIPGAFASLNELVALAEPLKSYGLPYASHMRNEDDQLLAAIEEALNVGRLAGVPVQVSHLKAQGQRNWWKAGIALQMLEQARAEGLDVTFDRYPYVAYSTGLSSIFPVWARDGGTDAFLERLQDPEQQPRIERDARDKIAKLGSWDAVQITSVSNEAYRWVEGGKLGTLAQERGMEPYRLLEELTLMDQNRTSMVGFGMSEENTALFLKHPLGMVCSDGGARAPYGPLSQGTPHPRTYGSFPRVVGYYCREQNLMPLETAIYKMTGMPAERLKFKDRGRIAPGAFADLVVFDPQTVEDRATFKEPHQYPVGIPHVIVNGTFVIRDGEHTNTRSGRIVKPEVPALKSR